MSEIRVKREWSSCDDAANGLVQHQRHQRSKKERSRKLELPCDQPNNNTPRDGPSGASPPVQQQRPPPGMRCAEVFVTANAHQWTFVCTFCNKTTRDIGDFICHIKMQHLPASSSVAEIDGEFEPTAGFESNLHLSQEDQDYMDYSHYLDVSVHTEVEEFNYNGEDQHSGRIDKALKRKQNRLSLPQEKRHKADMRISPAADSFSELQTPMVPVIQSACGQYTGEEDFKPRVDEADGEEADGDEGDDSKWMFQNSAESASITNQSETNGQPKLKRRQIRGTAYCELCKKTFQYYSLYRNHMIKHSNVTPYKCNICQKGFKSKQAIRYHINTHKRKKTYACQLCFNDYYTENQFIAHMLTHEDEDHFPCTVCGKVLRTDKERTRHLEAHTSERPFRCGFCPKLFRLRHHLSNHMKMHRQYRCDVCREQFMSSIMLRKPYACANCLKSAGNSLLNENVSANPLALFGAEQSIHEAVVGEEASEMVSNSEQEDDAEEEDDSASGSSSDNDDSKDDNEPETGGEDNDEDLEEESPALVSRQLKSAAYSPTTQRYTCDVCYRSYSSYSGLNFHRKSHDI